jgi:signal transduction histidine kinase
MLKLLKQYVTINWLLLGIVAFLMVACSGQAIAGTYNTGPYGTCPYQADCPSTITTLPSGLQVNINLTNGQVIPYQGYNIIVTPLNGSGTSFKQVDFYINGALVHSQMPAADGTVQWFWNPQQYPGTDIKIVVTGQDGSTVTKEFQVTIGPAPSSSHAITSAAAPSIIQQITQAPGKVTQSIEHAIRNLPPAIKHSLPYFLFLILLIDILLMAYQLRRELKESRALQAILAREQQSGQLKKTFTELVSHYLRTPLTVIGSSLELLGSTEGISEPLVVSLRTDVMELSGKVDNLVTQAAVVSDGAVISATGKTLQPKPIWRQPLFFVPIVFIGIVAFLFDYLAQHAGKFSVSTLSLVAHIVLFGSFTIVLYLVLRQLQLHKRDVVETKRILGEEVEFNQSRDELIDKTAYELSGGLGNLDDHIAQLSPSKASELVRKGQQQLHDVVEKFVIARQLKGAASAAAPTPTRLSEVCAPATQALQGKAQAKGVSIDIVKDIPFAVRSPELLSLVIQTTLDNAVEYSPPNSHVEVAAAQTGGTLAISITDHGPGIPEDKRFALFQAFSKVEGAEVFSHEGMGFSLYLDKLIMSYLLGDIEVEAVSPQGTKVSLSLSL